MNTPDGGRSDPDRLSELAESYEITRELGRGGTAVVYHGRERDLGREVAIKVVHQAHVHDVEAVARLAREARLVAQLRHPNIVTLFGTRHLSDGSIALIMQYVPGRTLKDAIREDGPLPISIVKTVLREIAQALEYAHQRHGLVHRDIKPENIYLDSEGGRTLLSDFGIARTAEVESSLTLAGTALGTPAYMSPEQIDGLPLDGRSDLYSLGMVAYEMLTGQQPWAGHNLYTIIYKQKHEDLPPIADVRNDVPPSMQRAIAGLLRKDREQRWSDAATFLSVLRPPAAFGIAPPALTHRPPDRSAPPPPSELLEDSPTIVYRPLDAVPAGMASGPVAVPEPAAVIEPAAGSGPAAEPSADASTPRIRFLLEGEGQGTAVDAAERRREAARRGNRRVALVVALGVFITLIGAIAPLIGADDDRSEAGLLDPVGPAPAAGAAAGSAPADREPARIVVLTEDQTGYAGQPLPVPVGILVEDSIGGPVEGVAVELQVVDGDGSVEPAVAVTDSRGLAMTQWTLGAAPGPNALLARVQHRPSIGVEFRAQGVAASAPPARMLALRGDGQTGALGSVLADELVVRVEDAGGNPVAGARVTFSVTAGDGSVEPSAATTDAAGLARASWTVGPEPGIQTVRAVIGRSGIVAEFNAHADYRLRVEPRLFAGGTHTCRVGVGGTVACWGANDDGQLGSGSTRRATGAVTVSAPAPFARFAAGVSHTCALDRDGRAYCWGSNETGQLGAGDRTDRTAPAAVAAEESFVDITAGLAHTCALAEDGRAFCWGAGGSGQIGDGLEEDRTAPVPVGGGLTFTSLSAGWRHTCGIAADGLVYCWGSNGSGQLGNGTTSDRSYPTRIAGDTPFASIAAGAAHTCAATTAGVVYCWGQNTNGQLGIAGNRDSSRPVPVQGGRPLFGVVTGAVHSCALGGNGEAFCWGRNSFGQLGNEGTADSNTPVAVAGGMRFTFLTASGSHTCGRTEPGDNYCWGYNVDGQLGDGTRTDRSAPVRVRATSR